MNAFVAFSWIFFMYNITIFKMFRTTSSASSDFRLLQTIPFMLLDTSGTLYVTIDYITDPKKRLFMQLFSFWTSVMIQRFTNSSSSKWPYRSQSRFNSRHRQFRSLLCRGQRTSSSDQVLRKSKPNNVRNIFSSQAISHRMKC